MLHESFPDIIKKLPSADISIDGVQAWIAQGKKFQIVFFEIEAGKKIPPHNHEAQFGIVVEGEMTLTINGKAKRCRKGDTYYIPKGVTHQAEFHKFFRAIDFFDEPARYKSKEV
ncbi:MAG: cupin domain-containing protein [Promethearchaeota archaeon]